MQKFLKINLPLIFLFLSIAFVNSIPTSVLVNTKDVELNSKVKRSSNTNLPSSSSLSGPGIPAAGSTSLSSHHHKPDLDAHSTSSHDTTTSDTKNKNNDNSEGRKVSAESLFGANQGLISSSGVSERKSSPQKRGANSQLLYNDIFNNGVTSGIGGGRSSSVAIPNTGIWTDEIDPSVFYQDLQDFDDYPRGSYRAKPYDNLQSILNAEVYSEPVALPLQYPYRYYGDRKKRSNKKNNNAAAVASGIPSSYDMRLKRESKLTPADMLALVALVEAGERSRQEAAENDDNLSSSSLNSDYSRSYFNPYETQIDDGDYYGNGNSGTGSSSWVDPAIDYYGMPYNLESLPRYDVLKDQKLTSNYYPSKRYMITKKKRSLGHFFNEPINYPSLTYDNRFSSSDLYGKSGSKRYQKYF